MDPFFIVVIVVVSLVAVVSVVKVALGVPADIKILGDVLGDNPEKREETARNENEAFIRLMRDSDNGKQRGCPLCRFVGRLRRNAPESSATDVLLEEARNNFARSYELRAQENQSILSVAAILVGLFSAFIYLSKQVEYIASGGMYWLYLSLSAFCLAILVVAAVFLFESLKPTYLIPNSTETKIRETLQTGVKGESVDKVSVEIKYRLVAENAVRSKVNERSNILKSRCLDATRRYMRYAGVFLLLLLITWSAYKLYAHPVTCCCP